MENLSAPYSRELVSVIITCFNEGEYVGDAITSVLAQTVQERICEVLIVDDGSAEPTRQELTRLKALDARIRLIFQDNAGLPAARNRAIRECRGGIVAILDADDIWVSMKLEAQLRRMDASSDVGLVYSDLFLVRPENIDARSLVRCRSYQPSSMSVLREYFVHDAPIIPSTTLIRRTVFDKAGLFDASFRIAEDNEMWIRIIRYYPIAHVPEPLLLKRHRGNSLGADAVRNMPFYDRITAKAIGLFPELADLAPARRARRLSKAGQFLADRAEKAAALRYYSDAVRCDPSFYKVYPLILLLLMPTRIAAALAIMARRARHS